MKSKIKTHRVGDTKYNNFGSKIIISKYNSALDMEVYFPQYNYYVKCVYDQFKKGKIKCPYEPRIYGIGFIGEGKYKVKENGKNKKEFEVWYRMLERCYDPNYQEKHSTYKGCKVEEFLLNFQNMGKWIDENYYEVPGEEMCLDKDILHKGNKIYSRETCIFVPERINKLFIKCDKRRGDCPVGTTPNSSGNYMVQCSNGHGKQINLGAYATKEEAFQVYKQYKEKVIKKVIDSYEGKIPEPFYSRLKTAMYNYEIEIDD